jgi:hypothetical protein
MRTPGQLSGIKGIDKRSAQAAVIRGPECGKGRMSTVRNCCQETAVEDTAGWGRLSVCSSDL